MSRALRKLRAYTLALWSLAWVQGAPIARAESALVLPAAGDAGESARSQAETAIVDILREQGLSVSRHQEAAAKHPNLRRCKDLECAGSLPPELAPELLVAVAVWRKAGAAADDQVVFVTLRDARGRYPGEAAVETSTFDAASRALLQAQALRLLGPGPWVHVRGPVGAELEIDGARVGTLPYRGAIAAGEHSLRMVTRGAKPHEQSFDVPLKATQMVEVLVPSSSGPAHSAAPARTAKLPSPSEGDRSAAQGVSPWNYILGGALAVGALALAADPLRNAVRNDVCVGDTDELGRCSDRVTFGARSIGLTIAASALLLGSAYTFAFRPLRVGVDAGPDRAAANLHFAF